MDDKVETKIGILQQTSACYDYCGDMLLFENDHDLDIGLFDVINKYIIKNSDKAQVRVEAKDGEIVITRTATWEWNGNKFAWVK